MISFKKRLGQPLLSLPRMKNRVAILLALVLLTQGMSPLTGQLAKIPALVAHFYAHHDHEHHVHGDELSFFDFLAQHYGDRTHHDDASQDHSNLPFRCADASCAALLIALPSNVSLPGVTIAPVFPAKAVFASDNFYSGLFVRDIFRPPLV